MGDLPGKFPRRRVSEDKAHQKELCSPVGTIIDSISSRYNWYQSRDPARSVVDEDVGPLEGRVIGQSHSLELREGKRG